MCVALDGGAGAPDSSSPNDGSTSREAGDAGTVITFCNSPEAGTYSFCQDWDTPGLALVTADIENRDSPCTIALTDGGASPPSALQSSGGTTLSGQCDYKIDTGAIATTSATLDLDISCTLASTAKSGAGVALTFAPSSALTLALSGSQLIGLNAMSVDGGTSIGGPIIADVSAGAVCDSTFHHVKIIVAPAGGTALYVDGAQIGANQSLTGFALGDVKLRLGMMDNESSEATIVTVDNVVLSVK